MKIPTTIQSGPIGTRNPANLAGQTNLVVSASGVTSAPAAAQNRGPALAREHFPIRALNKIQTASDQATAIARALFPQGLNVIAGISFTAGQTVAIPHGLGRTWAGFMVVNRRNVPAPPRGTATLSSGSVVVTAPHNLVPNADPCSILLSYRTISGTPGTLSAPAASRTATTFTIQSSSAADNSTVDWVARPPWPSDFAGVPTGPNNLTLGPLDAATITITPPYTCTADLWVW